MTMEPVVMQIPDEKNTLLVLMESEDIKKICNTLWSIKMWLAHSVNIGCNIATPKQVSMGSQMLGGERRNHVSGTHKHAVT